MSLLALEFGYHSWAPQAKNQGLPPCLASGRNIMLRLTSIFLVQLLILFTLGSCPGGAGEDVLGNIKLPAGFRIDYFSTNTPNARSMALGDDGTVYVGTYKAGKVYALRDENGDGIAEKTYVVGSSLNAPNGVAVVNGDLYIAEVHRIIKLEGIAGRLDQPPTPRVVFDGYPKETHHGWRYLRVGPDRKLYVPVGAPCNICQPDNEMFATLTRLDPDGRNLEIFARGIRNTVGFDWHPQTGDLFFTDNGRDWLGNDSPAEELNAAQRAGLHFGYPFCHGGDMPDPEFGGTRRCAEFTPPAWKFPAHVAPLGVRFYTGRQFPEAYRQQLFVAQHGSWNRNPPLGYRVVRVDFHNGKPVSDQVFADGWLRSDGAVLGRPVDVLELRDGSLLVSDDHRGAVYRISYRP